MTTDINDPRWEHYVFLRGEQLQMFWAEHLRTAARSLLFVVGRGFDPRAPLGLKLIVSADHSTRVDVLGLDFREGPMSPSLTHEDLVNRNWSEVGAALEGRGSVTSQELEFWSKGRRISSQSARDLFGSIDTFTSYTDVIVDISAMPRSVYFPLIARLLHLVDHADRTPPLNLHVIVAEDADLDSRIREEGIDEKAEFMASFGGGFDEEGTPTPKVWIPMLGERRTTQFDRIHDRVKPDEICPVLPSPSKNPRRADNIVIEYQRLLFDEHRLNPIDFLYASEQNPFEVYRRLRSAVIRYGEVFKLLGGCRVALSPLSSKLMSLGALLVAYEMKVLGYGIGVAHIESQGYTLEGTVAEPKLFGLWLAGECDA
jgi:hypothetical protein